MTDSAPRLAPVTDPSPEVVDLYVKGGMRNPAGETLNIFGTLAHHPALLRRWLVFAGHVLSKSTLTPRDRELLILRTGVRCNSQYEFSQHAIIARRSDITDEEIDATKRDIDDHPWSDFDATLLRAADELHDDSRLSDATWATLTAKYSDEQLLDAIFAVGNYHIVSMVLNSCGVQLDEGVPAAL
ncbi:MAG: Carboxymuconolactone decarboxylase [Ilumatobacteraceae bacterium]|nr:Carboxymuconolactone decarboxylase [Ilumatobacteraceae bacterium]